MTDVSSHDIAKAAAERFGLTMVEAEGGRALSLLFTGQKANENVFRRVLSYMLVDCGVTHQFSLRDFGVPGIHLRGLTPSGDVHAPIYLVVVGDPRAAEYVPTPQATRSR